jgi:hypothetical protein
MILQAHLAVSLRPAKDRSPLQSFINQTFRPRPKQLKTSHLFRAEHGCRIKSRSRQDAALTTVPPAQAEILAFVLSLAFLPKTHSQPGRSQ